MNALIGGLTRCGGSKDTVLAVKLNRAGKFDPITLEIPELPFSQVWLFGSTRAVSMTKCNT
nr:hypothetical protein [Halomonas socia]